MTRRIGRNRSLGLRVPLAHGTTILIENLSEEMHYSKYNNAAIVDIFHDKHIIEGPGPETKSVEMSS